MAAIYGTAVSTPPTPKGKKAASTPHRQVTAKQIRKNIIK
jgi:hypothetical protein